MENYQVNYQGVSEQDLKTVLDFFNEAGTPEEIEEVLKKSQNISNGTRLSKSILAARNKSGGFTDVEQLSQVAGLNIYELYFLLSAFKKPALPVEEEKLQQIVWVHGTSLHVENPEEFGSIVKQGNGTRITGLEGAGFQHESFVHLPVPTPVFPSGSHLYIRSIFMIWRTSSIVANFRGPSVDVHGMEIWDGHQKLATNPPFNLTFISNGYLVTKLFVNSNHKINFGIGVSFKQMIEAADASELAWADYASMGVEFVTRNKVDAFSF